ncbi:IGF-like family receptor 1 isoform X2 [Saccopteryx leptura]|uniref:IGF-like family receptor 1 isoform X2 n=1 Tax=Saccopteryx leptura TaxID=249018 RepID=UPI00339D1514
MYAWRLLQLHAPETQLLELRRQLDDWEPRCRRCGRKSCGRGHPDCGLRRMGPQRLLLSAALLLAQTVLEEASQHCSRLEYWNPDNLCCGSCLQRFGPPPCPGYEFSENCGFNDFGDYVTHPFKKCPRGQCNPDSEELCSSCGGRARPPTPAGTPPRCREKPVPTKEPCPVKPETPSVLNSLESSLPAISNASRTSEYTSPWQALLTFAPPVVLVLLVTAAAILLLTLQRHSRAILHPYPDLACDYNTSRGSLEASEAELPNLASQPLSRLLDELEVLEELIVLLDPEPGPGGALACGTTRHLAARYGLPAAWSTFAYSLRPSRSPLRALIEMVVAREPSASLGQLGTHLAQLGRADALQVLSKLGSSGACLT